MMNQAKLISFLLGIACIHGEQTTSTSKSKTMFSNVIQVVCDGIDTNTLDDISMTVFSQALEESFDDIDNAKTNGTYINVGWACLSGCKTDDNINPKKRRPRLQNGKQEGNTMKFEVDWICGDLCPDDNLVTSSFTREFSTSMQNTGSSNIGIIGNLRGTLPNMKGDDVNNNVIEWEKNLVRTLIDSRRKDFRATEACMIMTVPNDEKQSVI
jgi:hypothetical protein